MGKITEILNPLVGNEWATALTPCLSLAYFNGLGAFINKQYSIETIYPEKSNIFNAFNFTPFSKVNVVFVGLDPYTKQNQAYGVSFGVTENCMSIPPSLRNIYKEIEKDVYNGLLLDFDYSLRQWCDQGCFMYNTALTVVEGKTGSHIKNWVEFTKAVFAALNTKEFCIFVLLGKQAQSFKKYIQDKEHFYVIEASHPAAEAYKQNAGFFGSKVFTKINKILLENGHNQIKW